MVLNKGSPTANVVLPRVSYPLRKQLGTRTRQGVAHCSPSQEDCAATTLATVSVGDENHESFQSDSASQTQPLLASYTEFANFDDVDCVSRPVSTFGTDCVQHHMDSWSAAFVFPSGKQPVPADPSFFVALTRTPLGADVLDGRSAKNMTRAPPERSHGKSHELAAHSVWGKPRRLSGLPPRFITASVLEPTHSVDLFALYRSEVELRLQLYREALQYRGLLRALLMYNRCAGISSDSCIDTMRQLVETHFDCAMENDLLDLYEVYASCYPLACSSKVSYTPQNSYSSVRPRPPRIARRLSSCAQAPLAVPRHGSFSISLEESHCLSPSECCRTGLLRPSFHKCLPRRAHGLDDDLNVSVRLFFLEHFAFVSRLYHSCKLQTSFYQPLGVLVPDAGTFPSHNASLDNTLSCNRATHRRLVAFCGNDSDSLSDYPIVGHASLLFPDAFWHILLQLMKQKMLYWSGVGAAPCLGACTTASSCSPSTVVAAIQKLLLDESNGRRAIESLWKVLMVIVLDVQRETVPTPPVGIMPPPHSNCDTFPTSKATTSETVGEDSHRATGMPSSSAEPPLHTFDSKTTSVIAQVVQAPLDNNELVEQTEFKRGRELPTDHRADTDTIMSISIFGIQTLIASPLHVRSVTFPGNTADMGENSAYNLPEPVSGMDASLRHRSMHGESSVYPIIPATSTHSTWTSSLVGGWVGTSWGPVRHAGVSKVVTLASSPTHTSTSSFNSSFQKQPSSVNRDHQDANQTRSASRVWLDLAMVTFLPSEGKLTVHRDYGSYELCRSQWDVMRTLVENVELIFRNFGVDVAGTELTFLQLWMESVLLQMKYLLEMQAVSRHAAPLALSWQTSKIRNLWMQLVEEKRFLAQQATGAGALMLFECMAITGLYALYRFYEESLHALAEERQLFLRSISSAASPTAAHLTVQVGDRTPGGRCDEAPEGELPCASVYVAALPELMALPSGKGLRAKFPATRSSNSGAEEEMVTLSRVPRKNGRHTFVNSLGRVAWRTFMLCERCERAELTREWGSTLNENVEQYRLQTSGDSGQSPLRGLMQKAGATTSHTEAPRPLAGPLMKLPMGLMRGQSPPVLEPMPPPPRLGPSTGRPLPPLRSTKTSFFPEQPHGSRPAGLETVVATVSLPPLHSTSLRFWGHAAEVSAGDTAAGKGVTPGLLLMHTIVQKLQSESLPPPTLNSCFYRDHRFSNRDTYTGYWQESKRCGLGLYTFADFRITFLGDWLDDVPHGDGILLIIESTALRGARAPPSTLGRPSSSSLLPDGLSSSQRSRRTPTQVPNEDSSLGAKVFNFSMGAPRDFSPPPLALQIIFGLWEKGQLVRVASRVESRPAA